MRRNSLFLADSEEFDEAIAKLKLAKILYTISPEKDSTICIFEDIPISELIKPRINYVDEIIYFIAEYKEFGINKKTPNTTLELSNHIQ